MVLCNQFDIRRELFQKGIKKCCIINKICYNEIERGNRHRVVDQFLRKMKPSLTGQSTGKVSYILLTNQMNERQQC